jgi:hypothetical protein
MLALALCAASSLCYARGAIAQQRLTTASPRRPAAARWWRAAGFNLAGGVLHVAALGSGPVTMVQPLGALTLVFALPMRRERNTTSRSEWAGAALTVVALTGLVLFTVPVATRSAPTVEQLLLVAGTAAAATSALLAAAKVPVPVIRAMTLAAGAGIAFGTASALVPVLFTVAGWPLLTAGGLTACFALAGVTLSQYSYRDFGLSLPLAVQNMANPAAAALIGITVLGEGFRAGTSGLWLAALSALAMAAGVVLLARGEAAGQPARLLQAVPSGSPAPARCAI